MIFVVNQDWFFLSHRLPIARGARDAGANVSVVAGDTGKGTVIRDEGFEFVPLPISRHGLRPWDEWRTLRFLRKTYERIQPDLVHHVTLKPVIYGSLAARAVGRIAVVNALSGLGYVFSSSDALAKALRPALRILLRVALRHPQSLTILQNPEDRSYLERVGILSGSAAVVIRGSGVDCARFRGTIEPQGRPIVLLAARMLWDKGVKEFVEAARTVRAGGVDARFVLVGEPDPGNPKAIPTEELVAWAREGTVEWWGQRDDMPVVLAGANLVVLPTVYGEGVPKILLEAAASGRAIVASDSRGCREIVRPGVNGVLVPPRDAEKLAEAIAMLLSSPELRAEFGRAGSRLALAEFSQELVVAQTLKVYRDLLGDRWPKRAVEAQKMERPS